MVIKKQTLKIFFLLILSSGCGSSSNKSSENLTINTQDISCNDISFKAIYTGSNISFMINGTESNNFKIQKSRAAYPAYIDTAEEIYHGSSTDLKDQNIYLDEEYFYTLYIENNSSFEACISSSSIASLEPYSSYIKIPAFRQIDIPETETSFDLISRIPAIISLKKGALIAFVERRNGTSDNVKKSIILSKSFDNGRTWSDEFLVVDDGNNSVGNPTVIYDPNINKIVLLFSIMSEGASEESITDGSFDLPDSIRIFKIVSDDEGNTWNSKLDITASIRRSDFSFINVGPGIGIVDLNGKYIFPAYHATVGNSELGASSKAFMIMSDNNGGTFFSGNDMGSGSDENQIVELEDGSIKSFIRQYGDKNYVATSSSSDNGLNWSYQQYDLNLPSYIVQQATARLTSSNEYLASRIVFSNPINQEKRDQLTIKVSLDETTRWDYEKLVAETSMAHPDFNVGYSSLTTLNDKTIGILYEKYDNYEHSIFFSRFNVQFLSDNTDIITLK